MTPGRRSDGSGSDERSFAELIEELPDVVPIDPGRKAPPTSPRRVPTRPDPPQHTPQPLQFPNVEEPLLAHRSFVRRRTLSQLRAGKIRPDRSLDLHGHDRRSAERLVRRTIVEAARSGEHCVLIVAGRGHRSAGGVPVLRKRLPRWLADPALARHIVAFAPAIRSDGGRGAVYVLLTGYPLR